MAYGDCYTMINEHIIRAVEIKVMRKGALSYEEARGFIYIKPVFELLSSYDRDSYESFREFYPEIVELFNTISLSLMEERPVSFIETPFGIATTFGIVMIIAISAIFIVLRRRKKRTL